MRNVSLFSICFFLLLNTSKTYAQEIEWQNTIGGNQSDALRSIKSTADGGFIIAGMSAQ